MQSAVLFWVDEQCMVSTLFFIVKCLYCITVQPPTRKQLRVLMNDICTMGSQNFMWSQNQLPQKDKKKDKLFFEGKHKLKLKLCLFLYCISYLRFILLRLH